MCSNAVYHTHFYFNVLSLAAKISARWLHCHKHGTCYSIVSCSPLILIGAHFSSLAINQLDDLSLFKNMMKKRPCSEINAFKNSDPGINNTLQSTSSIFLPVFQLWLALNYFVVRFVQLLLYKDDINKPQRTVSMRSSYNYRDKNIRTC